MEDIIKEFKHRLKLNNTTVILYLCEFLEEHGSEENLVDFLEEKALFVEA